MPLKGMSSDTPQQVIKAESPSGEGEQLDLAGLPLAPQGSLSISSLGESELALLTKPWGFLAVVGVGRGGEPWDIPRRRLNLEVETKAVKYSLSSWVESDLTVFKRLRMGFLRALYGRLREWGDPGCFSFRKWSHGSYLNSLCLSFPVSKWK